MRIETEGETIYKDIKLFLWWNYNDFKKEGREMAFLALLKRKHFVVDPKKKRKTNYIKKIR